MPTEKALSDLDNVTSIQCADGNWNYDPYMQGMANGLILAQSIIKGHEPSFLGAPPEWLSDKPITNEEVENAAQHE